VAPASFGRLWNLYTDGQVVAQPLYVSQLAVDAGNVKGTFNAVLVATMHNTIYAYDADRENATASGRNKPLWARWLGQPRRSGKDIDMWSTNDPEWGIVSTPVIDAQKTTLWAVAWHEDDGGVKRYRLHALNLKDGTPRQPAIVIGGDPPNANQPCNYLGGFSPCKQKQRPALLLDRGVLYVGFGGDGSRGCMFAFDSQTLRQVGFWSVTPNGESGGLWQSGQGPAADAEGNVYVMTGNGTLDAHKGGKNYGESFVRLKLESSGLVLKDYFAPCNAESLNTVDMDLGAGGPVLIPNSNLLVGGGKEGILYLLSRSNLGQHVPGNGKSCVNANALQQFQATELHVHGAGTDYGHIHGSPVFWQGPDMARLFVWGENDRLKAYNFKNGKFVDLTKPKTSIYQPPNGMPGGMLALSSNKNKAGTAIVWSVVPLNGDANKNRGVRGLVIAMDARDVSRQLWTSELAGERDRLGLFAKYVPPTVAGGKVFVATYGNTEQLKQYNPDVSPAPATYPARYYLAVYGLLPEVPKPKPVVNQDKEDVTVLRATATEPVTLNLASCVPAQAGTLDCTDALEKKFGAPSIHTLNVSAGYDFAGCNLLRVTTATNAGAITVTSGIGWYAADATAGSQAMTSGRFVVPGRFKQTGTATRKPQTPVVLDEFIGVANCTAGQGSLDKLFKPFIQFDNSENGNVYRNWDTSPNYRISRAQPKLDRSTELLAP
ncbi:MAG TPA: hypothetical protein VJR89_35650, partial [Polyangiales bacterium]|nr:hypothetical protein [Polyangiales bacterium]